MDRSENYPIYPILPYMVQKIFLITIKQKGTSVELAQRGPRKVCSIALGSNES